MKTKNIGTKLQRCVSSALIAVFLLPCATVISSAETEQKEDFALKGSETFTLGQVTLTNPYFTNSFEREIDYLLAFDTDRLLAGFRETAGLDLRGAVRYSGWEDSLIGGHTIGHYLTACAQAYASLPDGDESKKALYDILVTMTDGLLECQDAVGTGFIFGATVIDKNNIEKQFDNVEENKTNIMTQAWVPWYTMHKILAGLVDVYKLTGYETAKTVASRLGDWCYGRTSSWNESLRKQVLNIEYGGMNDCLYELYLITGKDTHAEAAHAFDETALFETVLAGTPNALNNRHANTTIPKFLGALNRYIACDGKTVNGEVIDADRYLAYAEAFWDKVVDDHSYITGGNSEWEHFGHDNVLDAERTNCNCETCNTYNMLKLSRALFLITGNVKYADFYENTFINAIMSSQDPETGMSMYFQPMATGYFKVYGNRFEKFWCCTGSGMENFTKLSDSLYFRKDNILIVNQYISSDVSWTEKGVTVSQETNVPTEDTARFTVKTDGKADIYVYFRLPDWLASDAKITVNGNGYAYETVDGYAAVSGPFSDGDVIEITLPMEVRAYNLPDGKNTYAFKYGPVVLSALLGKKSMTSTMTGVIVTIPATKVIEEKYVPSESDTVYILNGQTVEEFIADINENLVKSSGELKFVLANTDSNLTFVPHFSQHEERYGIYWKFAESEGELNVVSFLAEKRAGRLADKLLDTVQPGYGQYENDELHSMTEYGNGSVGTTADGTSRHAKAGGSFSYRMIVDNDAETSLLAIFSKADNGKTVKISVGDDVIFEEKLSSTGTDAEYQTVIPIPTETVKKYGEKVTVDGEEKTALTFVFESAKADEPSARLCTFLYSVGSFGTDTSVKVECGTGETEYADGIITVKLDEDATSADVDFELGDRYGYLTVNGKVVDDKLTFTVPLDGKETDYALTVYAEDHTTSEKYTLRFVAPGEGIRANVDPELAYFVDCGDHDPSTLSEGDLFGTHNSVTEQILGKDPVTGYRWGLVDSSEDRYNGSAISAGLYTYNTWCYEQNSCRDGLAKTKTNRYTKNQVENGIDRHINYEFELENGVYEVEVGFDDPWGCSNYPTVTANESVIAKKLDVSRKRPAEGEVTVTDGRLTLAITSDSAAINVTYIKIRTVSVDEPVGTDAETDVPAETDESSETSATDENKSKNGAPKLGVIVSAAVAAIAAVGTAVAVIVKRRRSKDKNK